MTNYIQDKAIIVTGAASGFGRSVALKTATMGARVVCADINTAAVNQIADELTANGHAASAMTCDVSDLESFKATVDLTISRYGGVDVLLNSAGIMPLAFFANHASAMPHWERCIDINFRGVLNGCAAVHDQMISQGHGHIINLSSIYGNHPVLGGAVYGATKAAVNFLAESLRIEARGKIKVTMIKPSAVPTTGLSDTILDQQAGIGSIAHNIDAFLETLEQLATGCCPPDKQNPDSMELVALNAEQVADAIVHVINQPWGVNISDITLRASADYCVI